MTPPDRGPCRLYLVTPAVLDPAPFKDILASALDGGDVACVRLRLNPADADTLRRACDGLRPVAQSRGVAFLLDGPPAMAAAAGCDGVHVAAGGVGYGPARVAVGADRIVGVACGDSRHAAIEAAEAGADYVEFDASAAAAPDLVDWWSTLMTVPCVAGGGLTIATCAALAAAGADFLAVGRAVWSDPSGPRRAVADFNAAMRRHRT